jgi:hypothetical protein
MSGWLAGLGRTRRHRGRLPVDRTDVLRFVFCFLLFAPFRGYYSSLLSSVAFLRQRFILAGLSRLITSGYGSKTDRDPVPTVDRRNRQRQVNQLGFIEMLARCLESCFGNMRLRDSSHSLAPGQCRSFAFSTERRFPPCGQRYQTLRSFTGGQCKLALEPVHRKIHNRYNVPVHFTRRAGTRALPKRQTPNAKRQTPSAKRQTPRLPASSMGAPVDVQDFSSDEGGRCKIQHSVNDLRNRSQPMNRMKLT